MVSCSRRELRHDVPALIHRADIWIDDHVRPYVEGKYEILDHTTRYVALLIVDEAERLTTTALEWLRDLFDRRGDRLILIGMPGMDKRMARYAQLFGHMGFARHYRPLQHQKLTFVLTRRWRDPGLSLDDADFTDAQAVAAIARRRQLPAAAPPVRPDQAPPASQRADRHHPPGRGICRHVR